MSFIMASTKSTSCSSAGLDVSGAARSLGADCSVELSSDIKLVPVSQLKSASRIKPPRPIGSAPPPMRKPDPPRASSTLLRSPGVQRITPSTETCDQARCQGEVPEVPEVPGVPEVEVRFVRRLAVTLPRSQDRRAAGP